MKCAQLNFVIWMVSTWCLMSSYVSGSFTAITPGCLGEHSLSTPTPEPGLVNCPQYRELACCSVHQDSEVLPNANGTQLYNFNWNECGSLSTACQNFFQAESCYFECDPYQTPWANPIYPNPSITFTGVPICSTYCDAWFEACKDDYTCGTEWLYDFVPVYDGEGDIEYYKCAPDSQCQTFGDIFENAQGLCDVLWGGAFYYSEDLGNCVVWDFGLTMGNPNQYVQKIPYTESFCNQTYILNYPPAPAKTANEPQCLANREYSTPKQTSGLKNCPQYGEMSCCGISIDAAVIPNAPNTTFLGYNWTGCGPMSAACEKFFVAQACYFECDPYQSAFANPAFVSPSTFFGIPICQSYCNDWFEACKDDYTCGNEWLADFAPVYGSNGQALSYDCIPGNLCKKFSDLYDNSQNMCDVLWGSYYHYSEDEDNCVTWDFSGQNPHKYLQKQPYAEGYCEPSLDMKEITVVILAVLLGVTCLGMGSFIGFLIWKEKRLRPFFGEVPMKKLDN